METLPTSLIGECFRASVAQGDAQIRLSSLESLRSVLSSSSCPFILPPNLVLSQVELTPTLCSLPKHKEHVQALGQQAPEAGIMLCSITVVIFSLL